MANSEWDNYKEPCEPVFFIEHCYGSEGGWRRYSGGFDTFEQARKYLTGLCGWKEYRIARYERVSSIQEKRYGE